MRVAVLIPTRGERPSLLQNCLRLLKAQTLQPDHIEIVNDAPLSEEKDITWRYRIGYDRLRGKGFDVIALIEDDDYYAPDYLEVMVNTWSKTREPIFGTNYTIYYHIRLFRHYRMNHTGRSSAMSTLIVPDLKIQWCADSEPYTDMHLWMMCGLKYRVFAPDHHICLGIKGHEQGMTGGGSHTSKLTRYTDEDNDKKLLRSVCDPESFEFYSNFHNKCASL